MTSEPCQFDYESDLYLQPSNPVVSHQDAVRFVTKSLPPDFYAHTERQISLTSWLPWPGNSTEFIPDEEFIHYCQMQDAERIPSVTTYHGHTLLMPVVRINYLGRSRKFLKLTVTFLRRKWDNVNNLTVEEKWLTVPAVQGDNNIIRLLEELPGETDLDIDQSLFFTETPEEVEKDYETRMERAYGAVLSELV